MNFGLLNSRLHLNEALNFVFQRESYRSVLVSDECMERVANSEKRLLRAVEERLPIYGVTTGFGDSCFRFVDPSRSEQLQANLIAYLLCGTGAHLSLEASRAMMLIRLKSLSRGYSGVSADLIERLRLFLERDWVPVVPCEGSLGASGDLIPLAYLAQVLQGQGQIHFRGQILPTQEILREAGVPDYRLKVKEGLALVNGTSAMAGLFLTHIQSARTVLSIAEIATAWLTLALGGRTEPFGVLVNEKAGQHRGQAQVAERVRGLLQEEGYSCRPLAQLEIKDSRTTEVVQDRYSLRCSPQILGPVAETVALCEGWLEDEINGTADNPLLDEDGSLGMGGNFYGGYLSQGMDYLKISLANVADMQDRQLASLIDEKSNRGLPANLANWPGLAADERNLHHGLKGLHQAMSAITSEVMAKAMPNSIFSRSAESHNQDKVSLGMSAAIQCGHMIDQIFNMQSLYLICLAQALDLREIRLQGAASCRLFETVRRHVSFVRFDQPLDNGIAMLSKTLRSLK